jgi:hypothetical protein
VKGVRVGIEVLEVPLKTVEQCYDRLRRTEEEDCARAEASSSGAAKKSEECMATKG